MKKTNDNQLEKARERKPYLQKSNDSTPFALEENKPHKDISDGKDKTAERKEKNASIKGERERIEILGIKVPLFCVSIFTLLLGYGGFVTPLLLLAGVLVLCRVKSQTLTSNMITVFALYGAQFVIETCLKFLADIPSNFFTWLLETVTDNIEFSVLIGKMNTAFGNVFSVLGTITSIMFFVFYICSIISLFRSDKIKIPIINDIIKKIIK